jgi:hypothetical protein
VKGQKKRARSGVIVRLLSLLVLLRRSVRLLHLLLVQLLVLNGVRLRRQRRQVVGGGQVREPARQTVAARVAASRLRSGLGMGAISGRNDA